MGNRVRGIPRISVGSWPRVFPRRTIRKLIYHDGYTVTSSTIQTQVIRSALNDVNFTGTGHQPMGFDQLIAIYNSHRVKAMSVTVKVVPNVTNTNPIRLTVAGSSNSTTPASVNDGIELAGSTTRFGIKPAGFVSIKKYVRGRSLLRNWNDDDTWANGETNPVTEYYIKWYTQPTGTAGTASYTVEYTVVLYTEWTNRIDFGGS